MRNATFEKGRVIRYLAWTFALAYAAQFLAAPLYDTNRPLGQLVIAAMMFAPALGAVLAGADLKGMGWKPRVRQHIKPLLIAWFAPMVFTAVGAGLYFLIFPQHFDLSGEYLKASGGAEALQQMEAQGISYPIYALISVISSVTYAPLVNMFLALGEEIGWRGFLYPQLKARFGRSAGLLLGGVIWGVWHWPLIWLIGYEYGAAAGNAAGYFGFPVTGMLAFCVFTTGLGALHDLLYERCGSIWAPALFHGAINGASTLPLMVCAVNTGTARLLGPALYGILAGLPMLAAAVAVALRSGKSSAGG